MWLHKLKAHMGYEAENATFILNAGPKVLKGNGYEGYLVLIVRGPYYNRTVFLEKLIDDYKYSAIDPFTGRNVVAYLGDMKFLPDDYFEVL